MTNVFDEIRKTQTPTKPIKGLLWINMLVEFDTNGKAKVLRSFTKTAKESLIKNITKPKKEIHKPIEMVKDVEKKDLF